MYSQQIYNMVFSKRRIAGFSTGFLLLIIGIGSAVVASIDGNDNRRPNCGIPGYPPLRNWLFGTAISYIILSATYCLMTFTDGRANNSLFKWVTSLSGTFLFAWMIVGCVSLWRDGSDCHTLNPMVWQMGMAAVIVSIFIVLCGGYVSYRTKVEVEDE